MNPAIEFTGTTGSKPLTEGPGGVPAFASPGSALLRIKKILVPVDFSDCSNKALIYAIQVAREFGATVDLLYVIAPFHRYHPHSETESSRMETELKANGEKKLAALVRQQIPQGLLVETFVRSGRPATQIVGAAEELKNDLIIIGTHGYTGLKVALGGTTENVVRHAPCPVLVVREKQREFLC